MPIDIARIPSERKTANKKNDSDSTRELFPQRADLPPGGIAVPDQKLQLMGH
jgi:hypothetical protein